MACPVMGLVKATFLLPPGMLVTAAGMRLFGPMAPPMPQGVILSPSTVTGTVNANRSKLSM